MKSKGYILFFVMLSISQLIAQLPNRGCGTAVPDAQYDALFQQKVLDYLNQTTASARVQSTYQIPVIIHVIHNGQATGTFPNIAQAQINSQIQVLNDDYSGIGFNATNYPATAFQTYATNTIVTASSKDSSNRIGISNTGISFCLALKDSLGNMLTEPGIERIHWNTISGASNPTTYSTTLSFTNFMNSVVKPATIWSTDKYLNIWISDINPSAGLVGYSAFPPLSGLSGISGIGTSTTDGLWCWAKCFGSQAIFASGVYSPPYNYGRTATHELSHYLGIRHIWGDASCATDYCNDTPGQQGATYGTATYPYLPNNCPSTTPPTGANGVMFMNFADYTDDSYMYMFTDEQKVRMQTAMVNSPYRNQLGTHGFCNSVITPTANFSLSAASICQGQSVSITDLSLPSGLISSWNYSCTGSTPSSSSLPNPALTFNTPGIYTISLTVTSAGSNSSITKVLQVTPLTVVNVSSQSVTCFGMCNGSASVTANGSGPFTYSWSPIGATTASVNGLCAGQYTCVVSNNCGMSFTNTVNVNQPSAIVLNSSVSNPTVCSGNSSSLSITPSGGQPSYNFNWSTGAISNSISVTPTVVPTSTYNVIVTDANGCTSSKLFSLTVNPIPTINANHLPLLPICAGKTATINLTGASGYTTNPGNITGSPFVVSPTITTVYNVAGSSPQGCIGYGSDTIKVYQLPIILSNVNSNTICVGSSLTFSNAGGASYTLSPTALTGSVINTFPSIAGTTIYTISGTSPTGCINTKTVSISVFAVPNVTISPSNTTICSGQSINLTVSGANTYTWNTGFVGSSISPSPALTTTYSVIGKNSSGCGNSAFSTVNVVTTPVVSISSPSTNVCFGYTMAIIASGAVNYQWFNGTTANTTSVQPLSNITYTVIGNNGGLCADTAYLPITILSLPSVLASANNTLVCVGQTVNLNVTGTAITYTWMPGFMFGPTQIVQMFAPTTFTAYGQGSNGCAFFSTVYVDVSTSTAIIPVSTPSAVCIGDTSFLSVIGGTVPLWSSNAIPNTSIVTPTANTSFTVNAIDVGGCVSDIVFNVDIAEDCNVNVYNGFTPNGDGVNDFWIIDNIDKYPNNKVHIYNRWGNKMFQTVHYNNTSNVWDGKLNGKPLTPGTYFYIIENDNGKLFKKGWIEITN